MIKKINNEKGAVALMTLVFLIALGAILMTFLWGIARVTGAYNFLYAANQNAAYSAVSKIDASLQIKCNTSQNQVVSGSSVDGALLCTEDPLSTDADAFRAADDALRLALPPDQREKNFGMCYDPGNANCTVTLFAETAEGRRLGAIKVITPDPNFRSQCSSSPILENDLVVSGNKVACWSLSELGTSGRWQYFPGVIIRIKATIPYFPGCDDAFFCPEGNIEVAAAASQGQPEAEGY